MRAKIEGDRLVAFLAVSGKVYESDADHQECLEMYYADCGIQSEFDYTGKSGEDYDEVHNRAIQKTYALKNAHEVYGFDLFDTYDNGYVLLAHDKETYNENLEWMKEYQFANSENSITLGYFIQGFDSELTEDSYMSA